MENVRGRGHVRLMRRDFFKRAAVIAALNRAGFSLAVAGRIAYFVPFHWSCSIFAIQGTLRLGSPTPIHIALLPLRLRKANANWFNPCPNG